MGGQIWIESDIGKGAKFIFTIKLKQSKKGEANKSPLSPDKLDETGKDTAGEFKGKRMLLAEDIDINCEILSALLEDTGIAIDYAINGEEAVNKITAEPDGYDIILMDIQMPRMDGYEATRRIRAFEAERKKAGSGNQKRIPIIAMTANVFREDIEKCLAAGMNDHIGKPVGLDDMMSKLSKYLNHPNFANN